ncbi:hypothetical protein H1P_3160002 [Hyella patelloides LEGE 07179]|uniref:Uncharacterized protein n=1 Tax=Hyella patelloides LEGE 07179 TaxID=945734 RepID=A0A563VUU0_9CYAN|nr:hypothetical protein H1P_3160002 [Hyella patelloides LEGE 07179]
MSDLRKNEHQLVQINGFIDNYQRHSSMLEVQILKLKLKEEKLRDKIIFQSIKDKISTR